MMKKKGAQQGQKEVPVPDTQAPLVSSSDSGITWREQLDSERIKFERHLVEALEKERQQSEREWRQTERSRIDEQERKFLDAIAFRQAKLESEWVLQRKTDSEGKALDWLRENQRIVSQELQQNMQKLRQDMDSRQTAWQEQSGDRLVQLESEWRERFGRELQRLEADWREQEILHRESTRFAALESEIREKHRQSASLEMQHLRDEMMALQKDALNGHLLAMAEAWLLVQEKWHQEWQTMWQRQQQRTEHEVLLWQKQVEHGLGSNLTEWKQQIVEQVERQGLLWQQAQAGVIDQWLKANLTGWNAHVADVFQQWLTKEEERIVAQIAPLVEKTLCVWQGRWQDIEEQMKRQNETRLNEIGRQIREDNKVSRAQLLAEVGVQVKSLADECGQKVKADLREWEEAALGTLKSACETYVANQSAALLKQHQAEIELLGQDFRSDLGRLFESNALVLSAKYQSEAQNLSYVYREMFRAEQESLRLESGELNAKRLLELSASWQQETARLLEDQRAKFSQDIDAALLRLAHEVMVGQDASYQVLADKQDRYHQELAAVLHKEFAARFQAVVEGWASRMETQLSTWHTLWDDEWAGIERQAVVYRAELESLTKDSMRSHQAQIDAEITAKMQEVYARWIRAIDGKLGEVELLLQSAIGRSVAELVTEIERAYVVRIDAVQADAHLDYRRRLGKLADELTARHKDELATLLESRNEALKEYFRAELSNVLRPEEQKIAPADKVFINSRGGSKRGR